ncbi:MAG: hypothetical protein FWC44_03085 [Methanomassiliicoccaceae archaeon]|nr:hypothetical protein [Methanomassiliicoccaceae archaeon]
MKNLAEAAEGAAGKLSEAESRREKAIKYSREIIRETKRMIHSIHMSEDHSSSKKELCRLVRELTSVIEEDPVSAGSGPADDALAEYAEAMILEAAVNGKGIPSFDDLGIAPGQWVLGIADCLGEMRRVVLSSLISENTERAVSVFKDMEEMYLVIMAFDVPDAVLPIRRKQDIARGIMERTRTDVTNAVMMKKMRN